MDPVCSRVRVFIVGSIAGGVGSGMILDLAYAARTVLLEHGIPDEDVFGILLHSTGKTANERDLTVANTCAFLGEMNHFSSMAGYPGDETCNLPPFDEDSRPFSSTYVVHLGDELNQREYDQAVDGVAEYLFLNTSTPCGAYFERCRSEGGRGSDLRTFSIRTADLDDADSAFCGTDLARLALELWTNQHEATHKLPQRGALARTFLEEHCITIDGLTFKANSIIESHIGSRPDEHLASMVRVAMQESSAEQLTEPGNQLLTRISNSIGQLFECAAYDDTSALCNNAPPWAVEAIGKFIEEHEQPLNDVVMSLIMEPGARFAGANSLRNALDERLQLLFAELSAGREKNLTLIHQAESRLNGIGDDAILDPNELVTVISEYVQRRLGEMILFVAQRLAHSLVETLNEQANDTRSHRNALADCLRQFDETTPMISPAIAPEQLDEMQEQIDRHLESHLYLQYDGLLPFLQVMNESRRSELLGLLYDAACRAARHVRRTCDIETTLSKAGIVGEAASEWVERSLGGTTPKLAVCGGASRLLLAVPDRSQPRNIGEWVSDRLGQQPTIVPATSGNIVACHEIEKIRLEGMIYHFFCKHPESIEFVSRIHTRVDIDWTPLSPKAVS